MFVNKYWSIFQAVLFYLVWYIAVLAASHPEHEIDALLVQLGFVGICLLFTKKTVRFEITFALLLALFGSCVDSISVYAGFISFPTTQRYIGVYPYWMIGMWLCFASAFSTSLFWMKDKRALQLLFGALGGPLSLYAASAIGAVFFPKDLLITLLYFGVEWAIIVPLSFVIFRAKA